MNRRPPTKPPRGRSARRGTNGRPVDLASERRIRDRLDELRAMLDAGEVDPGRTRAMLARDLEARPMDDVPTSLRLPADLVARADALAERMGADPALAAMVGGRVTRSAVLRLALERGVAALEAAAVPAPSSTDPAGVLAELDVMRAQLDALGARVAWMIASDGGGAP